MIPKNSNLVRGFLIAGIVIIFLATAVLAATNTTSIMWFSMDGGGETSTSGNFTLSGTIGQPDAGTISGGSNHTVIGGFRIGKLIPLTNQVYIPLVNR
jgi:hypothetical protein